jgi:protein TonB
MNRLSAVLLAFAALAACEREPVAETAPRQLTPPPFQYPEELWDAGVQGKTVLSIRVNEQGTVDSVKVDTTSGHKGFDSAAVAGTTELRFAPATRGGAPVARWVVLPVEFQIQPIDSAAQAAAPDAATP